MTSEEKKISSAVKILTGIPLARRFYEIALEEFSSGDRERQKNGCEKGFRAATESLDVLFGVRGYVISVGQPEAHSQRSRALLELVYQDSSFKIISRNYSEFVYHLHGICFYTNDDPKGFEFMLKEVKEFIDRIEELI